MTASLKKVFPPPTAILMHRCTGDQGCATAAGFFTQPQTVKREKNFFLEGVHLTEIRFSYRLSEG